MFGKSENKVSLVAVGQGGGRDIQASSDASPELEAEAQRLDGLPLAQLAVEVMSKAFTADYDPGARVRSIWEIAASFGPANASLAVTDAQLRVRDIVAEGLQVLEQARLVRLEIQDVSGSSRLGYVSTRSGRAALANNSVAGAL